MRGATLRTCVHFRQHASGRRPGLVLADQPSSTMLPELPPSHPGNRLVLYCPTSASQDQAGPRNTNHESDNRHTCPCAQVQSSLLDRLPRYRGAVVRLRPSTRQPYLASLTRRRSTQTQQRLTRSQAPSPTCSSVSPLCITMSCLSSASPSVRAAPGKVEAVVTAAPHKLNFNMCNCNAACDRHGVSPASCPRRVGSRQIAAPRCTPCPR